MLIVSPFASLAVQVVGVSVALGVIGCGEALRGVRAGQCAHTVLGVVLGAAAVVLLLVPELSLAAVLLTTMIALLVQGGVQAYTAIRHERGVERVSSLLFAAARIGLGVLGLTWPDVSVLVIAALLGAQLMLVGVEAALTVWRGEGPGRGSARAGWRSAGRLVGAVLAVAAVAGAVALSGALSATPRPDSFYTARGAVPDTPGQLLRSEPFSRAVPENARAWRVLYTTTRDGDRQALASALVIVPRETLGAGTPVIAWAHGTTGFTEGCAPSLLDDPFVAGAMPALDEVIDAGWAVVATDYAGLGTAGHQPYLIGESEGRSVLDAVRAASTLTEANLADETLIWGHSQGGHAALWAGGLQPAYAPEMNLLGVAAMAPATDLPVFLEEVSASPAGGVFGSFVIAAYAAEYDDVREADYVRPGARIAMQEMAKRCLQDPATLVSIAETLVAYDPVWRGNPAHGALLERAAENVPVDPIDVPLFIGQGLADDLVLPELQRDYVAERRAAGQVIDYREYSGQGHMGLVSEGSALVPELLEWSRARLSAGDDPTVEQ